MSQRILVTGSQGYLGSRLTHLLGQAGHRVSGFDTGFFRDCLIVPHDDGTVIGRDVRSLGESDLDGIDAVVHLAGISNDPFGNLSAEQVYDPTRHYTRRIAALCKQRKIRFIFASSCSIYGVGSALLDETAQVHPQTAYSRNKLEIEQDLAELAGNGFNPIALRFATAFGPSPRPRFDIVINMLTAMAVATGRIVLNSDGTAWRPFVHIDDICQSIMLALDLKAGAPGEDNGLLILNVGDSAQNHRVIDIAHMVAKAVPGTGIFFAGQDTAATDADIELIRDRKVPDGRDNRNYQVSFDRIQSVMPSFRCQWPVAKGIAQMVEIFQSLPLRPDDFRNINYYRLQKIDHLFRAGRLDPDLHWIGQPTVS